MFFPAEEHNYRSQPGSSLKPRHANGPVVSNGHADSAIPRESDTIGYVREPIPAPWTYARFSWAMSLWWSLRGIGWNYCCPLPSSAFRHPFKRASSRRGFVVDRLVHYLIGWCLWDINRSFMNLGPGRDFFSGRGEVTYQDLGHWRKGLYSICLVERVCFDMEKTHTSVSILFVLIGGIFGWDTEIWSPWGWPPLFGSFQEIWQRPGLSYLWSRVGQIRSHAEGQTWQGYFRRWLYLFGWIGIGENLLGLKPSGMSSHPRQTPTTPSPSAAPTPTGSARVSPSHPLPTEPPQRVRMTLGMMASNFTKSLIVFGLSGLIHDLGIVALNMSWKPDFTWRDCLVLTPFFAIQPVGLALEAALKSLYRGWKLKWQGQSPGPQPAWLTFFERLVGFIWTWTWLGWTAGWWVEGLCQAGMYRRGPERINQRFPSLVGGLVWDAWWH